MGDSSMDERVAGGTGPIAANVVAGETYWWCVCGRSKTQPFCDGSHEVTSLEPLEWVAPETRKVLFCTCKKTGTIPVAVVLLIVTVPVVLTSSPR